MFKEGRDKVIDSTCSGRQSTSHINENVTGRISVKMIAQTLNIQIDTMHTIMTNHLNMRKYCSKVAPQSVEGRTEGQSSVKHD